MAGNTRCLAKVPSVNDVTIFVGGRAVPMERPRINVKAVLAQVRRGRAAGPLVFTPAKSKRFQKAVSKAALNGQSTSSPLRGFLRVHLWFLVKKPKTLSKYSLRPDVDNYVKNVFDGLSDGGVISDDAWIDEFHVYRVWVNSEFEQETIVHITQK